ncbi:sortase [Candidatus Berkelbacteria bacterium]|nr:sortase [Candidatus Berkelbacteria bacterium]
MSTSLHLKRIACALVIFGSLILIWQWRLAATVALPALIQAGLIGQAADERLDSDGLRYPALGIQVPLTEAAWTSPLNAQDWTEIRSALRNGVSLAYTEPTFAEAPLAFMTGHSSDVTAHRYASVFAGLGQAQVGDQFFIQLGDATYPYTVADRRVLNPGDIEAFRALGPSNDRQRVVLVTCWPVLTTKARLVVIGERADL